MDTIRNIPENIKWNFKIFPLTVMIAGSIAAGMVLTFEWPEHWLGLIIALCTLAGWWKGFTAHSVLQ